MKKFSTTMVLVVGATLIACQSSPPQSATVTPAKSEIQFIDLQGFDRELASSLSVPLPKIDVAFYDRIVPSALPERLQHWMASVEAGGGTVEVVQPKSDITAKNPFLLISAISAIWSASKMVKELSAKAQFNSAHAYDAQIILKPDANGESVVDKVIFLQRKR